jgi:hypothetical protein
MITLNHVIFSNYQECRVVYSVCACVRAS